MENNKENAIRFFASNINCLCKCRAASFSPNTNSQDENGKLIMSPSLLADIHEGTFSYKDFYLVPKLISTISETDAIEVAKIMGMDEDLAFIGRMLALHVFDNSDSMEETLLYNMHCEAIDFLRKQMYAVDFLGVSVISQAEFGWIKIIG